MSGAAPLNKSSTPTRYIFDGLRSCPKCGKAVSAVIAERTESTTIWKSETCEEMSPHHCCFRPCCVISERVARRMIA